MKYVLTLIGKELSDLLALRVARNIGSHAGSDWLGQGEAVDIYFDDGTPETAALRAREALSEAEVDLAIQPADNRRRKLLIADMDSTIITVECIDELADALGLRDEVARITEEAMAGRIEFAEALRRRVAMLQDLEEQALEEIYDTRVRLTPGARTLVMTMRANGAYTALVSGGFTFFTERVAAAAGFDENVANRLHFQEGRLRGTVAEPIVDASAKLETLRRLTLENGLREAETLAVGDGANDRQMIDAAGLGVAFRAKPVLAEAADVHIKYGDLTALLYLQGYRKEAFVS